MRSTTKDKTYNLAFGSRNSRDWEVEVPGYKNVKNATTPLLKYINLLQGWSYYKSIMPSLPSLAASRLHLSSVDENTVLLLQLKS